MKLIGVLAKDKFMLCVYDSKTNKDSVFVYLGCFFDGILDRLEANLLDTDTGADYKDGGRCKRLILWYRFVEDEDIWQHCVDDINKRYQWHKAAVSTLESNRLS